MKIEIGRFSDKRLMLLVRFLKDTNFRLYEDGSCTWVPTKKELEDLRETLEAIDVHNVIKKEKRWKSNSLAS